LKELLELVQRGTSYTEAFVSARHLENVRDWKSFILPHLLTRGDTITGITFPHYMRFYMENGVNGFSTNTSVRMHGDLRRGTCA
jgi:hypothetical protein